MQHGISHCASGAVLTISSNNSLTINGSTKHGILNQGTVENHGTIAIGSTASTGPLGIKNEGVFNNNVNGMVKIDRSTGIAVESMAVLNTASSIINNDATIDIGSTVGNGDYGIENYGTINNTESGVMQINRCTSYGINSWATFINSGVLDIGAIASNGSFGLYNNLDGVFDNNSSGIININRSLNTGLTSNGNAIFNNSGAITIGNIAVTVGYSGMVTSGTFSNNPGGTIIIDRSTNKGLDIVGTFNNFAIIKIGSIATVGSWGILNGGDAALNNFSGGEIFIDRTSTSAIYNSSSPSTVAKLKNYSLIKIGALGPLVKLIDGNGPGMFENNTNATLQGTGSISSANFSNLGGTLSPGYSPGKMTFNAAETFASSTLSMEISGGGGVGGTDFDQIVVSGVATLSATTFLSLNFSYPTVNGTTYDILTATSISGTIPTGNISFTNTGSGNVTAVTVTYPGGNIVRVTVNGPTSNIWTGATNTDWGTASNWTAGVPDGADDVTIPNVTNDPIISNAALAKSVTVQSGGLLTISATFSLSIDGSSTQGILNQGTVQNNGTINIGNATSTGQYCIQNQSLFNNNPGGVINLDRSTSVALYNAFGTFNNAANITIGAINSVGSNGITNGATFNNNAGGIIHIDRSTVVGIFNEFNSFSNFGTLNIGQNLSVGTWGIVNDATFNNSSSGIINGDRSTLSAIENRASGNFANTGSITLGAAATTGQYGIENRATFNNNSGGLVNIDRISTAGIYAVGGTFTNKATSNIGSIVPITDLITGTSGTFSNSSGGILKGTGNIESAKFTNASGTLSPGYSPGKMTFNAAETFASSTLSMEISGGGGVGGTDFDQIVVSGVATLSATTFLALNFSYPTANGTTYDILTATSISGTITTGNISFTNTGSGNVTAVTVTYPGGNIVRVTVTAGTTNIWTGATNTDWATASNWTAGVPDGADDVTIPNVTNDPIIGSAALAKSVTVQSGGLLTISATFSLSIDGSSTQGILNQGTVQNNGTINIGNATSTGQYCIQNQSLFNNNPGAVINLDRSTSVALYNAFGTFNNAANITLGAINSVGSNGITNGATFNNNAGGIIHIDRSTVVGIFNETNTFSNNGTINIGQNLSVGTWGIVNNATFNNSSSGIISSDRSTLSAIENRTSGNFANTGSITLGAAATTGQYGIENRATFNNNSGGIVNIDRISTAGIYAVGGIFTNKATSNIGSIVPITDLIKGTSGTFSNSSGGILKGTGNIQSANFTNSSGTLSPGYSPGKMTFNAAETFASSTLSMEISGGGGVGGTDFDQIVVSGVATLSATTFLSLNFSYPTVNGTTYDILTATSISGTIPTGNISFTNSGSGNVTAVTVTYPGGNIVRVTATSPALPVQIQDFTGKLVGQKAILDWSTASEQRMKSFEIEHSLDGSSFAWIGTVAAAGNTTAAQQYNFVHNKPTAGINYYRLKQVEVDGSFSYSEIVSVNSKAPTNIRVYPNPTTGLVTIDGLQDCEATIIVRNAQGQDVLESLLQDNALNLSSLSSGLYTLQIVCGGQVLVERVAVGVLAR